MRISKAVGIDLGTTNSVIAMVGDDSREIICRTDRSGRKTFPSVVVYDPRSDSLQAGARAFARRGTAADPVVSIKSHMGDAEYRVSTGPKTLSPVEVSATILREMKQQMQAYLEENGYGTHLVERAVITIPAYFASNAREATTRAAEEAGLQVVFTLPEPTAAVLFYTHQQGIEDGIFLVYDLGGGTFDVSVVQVDGGDVQVLGIAGNNYLGGDNLDDELATYLLDDLRKDVDMGYDLDDFDPHNDPEDRRRFTKLKLVAESIKKALSLKQDHYEEFSNIFADKSGASVNLALEISRGTFEDLIRPILESTIDEVHEALAKAKDAYQVTLDMVDAVLLVGGSTHVPLVGEILREHFTDSSLPEHTKQELPLKFEPDMAVGYGAAIAAAGAGVSELSDDAVSILSGEDLVDGPAGAGDDLVLAPTFGPGSGYGGEAVVEGTLAALRGELPEAIFARVTRAGGGFSREYLLNADGSFAFTGLMSVDDPEPYSCEFITGETSLVQTRFDAAIRNAPRASVTLSRSYFLETAGQDGETEMVELMRQGESLPITRDYEFATNPSNHFFAVLRFFEEADFLKQITITFPRPVAPGTIVKLSLSCNLQSKFSARAEAGGVVVDTQFEPSPPPPLPTAETVADTLRSAREKVQLIPDLGKKIVAEKRLDKRTIELEDALAEGDAGKARDKLNEIAKLHSDVGAVRQLSPTPGELEELITACERANAGSARGGPRVAEEIQAAASEGRVSHSTGNQASLSKAVDELKAILQDLTTPGESGGGGGSGGERPPMWMLVLHFGAQAIAKIDAAEARTDLPEGFRRDQMAGASSDRADVRGAVGACTPPLPPQYMPSDWMSDEEAAPHFGVIQRVYQKWSSIEEMEGRVTKQAGR